MCVVQIKTFWLDIRYPQQATKQYENHYVSI